MTEIEEGPIEAIERIKPEEMLSGIFVRATLNILARLMAGIIY